MPAETAITAWPFDEGDGAQVREVEWGEMAEQFRGTGVIPGALNMFEVYADSSGMQVKVKSGKAFVQGHYCKKETETTLAISANASGNPRIDRVVVRLDRTRNGAYLAVVEGTPAGTPSAPALTQNAVVWETALAQVTIVSGAVTLAAATITDDERLVTQDAAQVPNAIGPGEVRLLADQATITFSAIPVAGFRHLKIFAQLRTDRSGNFLDDIAARFNADTGGNYDDQVLHAQGGATTANENMSATMGRLMHCPGNAAVASGVGGCEVTIFDYRGDRFKAWFSQNAVKTQNATAGLEVAMFAGVWRSTNPVTSITLLPKFGTVFRAGGKAVLYGVP